MQYLIKLTFTCPDGSVTKKQLHVAQDEAEMRALLEFTNTKPCDYVDAYCLGPIEPLPEWMAKGSQPNVKAEQPPVETPPNTIL